MALARPAPAFAALCGVAGAALAVVWADHPWSRETAFAVVKNKLKMAHIDEIGGSDPDAAE